MYAHTVIICLRLCMILLAQCGKIQLTWLENIWGLVLHIKGKYSGEFIFVFIFVMLIMINNKSERNVKCY